MWTILNGTGPQIKKCIYYLRKSLLVSHEFTFQDPPPWLSTCQLKSDKCLLSPPFHVRPQLSSIMAEPFDEDTPDLSDECPDQRVPATQPQRCSIRPNQGSTSGHHNVDNSSKVRRRRSSKRMYVLQYHLNIFVPRFLASSRLIGIWRF